MVTPPHVLIVWAGNATGRYSISSCEEWYHVGGAEEKKTGNQQLRSINRFNNSSLTERHLQCYDAGAPDSAAGTLAFQEVIDEPECPDLDGG
jgi:hypothetical protein